MIMLINSYLFTCDEKGRDYNIADLLGLGLCHSNFLLAGFLDVFKLALAVI